MSKKYYWDNYETAILVDYYQQFLHGKCTRKAAISLASKELRELAMSRHYNIDDVFRNENGISMQMSKIEDLFKKRTTRLSTPPQVFVDIVALYESDSTEFEKILQQAKNIQKRNENSQISFLQWLKKIGASNPDEIIRSINTLSLHLLKKKYIKKHLFVICESSVIEKTINEINAYEIVIDCTPSRRKTYLEYLSLYRKYLLNDATYKLKNDNDSSDHKQKRTRREKKYTFSIENAYSKPSKVESVLIKDFRRGFRPDSIMDEKRFLSLYEEYYGDSISLELVKEEIQQKCFLFDDRYFLPKGIVHEEVSREIANYLSGYFRDKDILYFKVLFSLFEQKFESYIYSAQMLSAFLIKVLTGTPLYFYETYCTTNKDAKSDISKEITEFLISIDQPCSYELLYRQFPYFDQRDIYNALHFNNPDILGNSKIEYFHVKSAHITKKESEVILSTAETLLCFSKYISCNDLVENLKKTEPVLIERLCSKYSVLGIRRLLAYYLRTDFDVDTCIITKKGQKMSVIDAYEDFARTHHSFTIEDVQDFSKYIGTAPYWDTIHNNSVRINADEFISDTDIEFDITGIDNAIGYYCSDYVTLKVISDFSRFPSCGTPWNIYLLQQYTYRFSEQYKMLSLGFAKGYASGVIVKKESEYFDFDSVLIDALMRTNISTPNEAIDYLCDQGFISERRYKKHTNLLKIAMARRNNS